MVPSDGTRPAWLFGTQIVRCTDMSCAALDEPIVFQRLSDSWASTCVIRNNKLLRVSMSRDGPNEPAWSTYSEFDLTLGGTQQSPLAPTDITDDAGGALRNLTAPTDGKAAVPMANGYSQIGGEAREIPLSVAGRYLAVLVTRIVDGTYFLSRSWNTPSEYLPSNMELVLIDLDSPTRERTRRELYAGSLTE